MEKLRHDNIMSLEEYAKARPDFRKRAMGHKKCRRLQLTSNATVYFEDLLTMQYQLQEILRAERIFEAEEIQNEIDVYNALIPDGGNWKATFMLEYPDVAERRRQLARLRGVAEQVYVRATGGASIYAIADEDMERETAEKTSSVHFLRFELDPQTIAAVRAGAEIWAGCEHPNLHAHVALPESIRTSLAEDLSPES